VLRAPGGSLGTLTSSVASLRGCGHGYAMAGGEMLQSWLGIGSRAREGRRGKGESG